MGPIAEGDLPAGAQEWGFSPMGPSRAWDSFFLAGFLQAEKRSLLDSPCLCRLVCYCGPLVDGTINAAFAFHAFFLVCHLVSLEWS